jgi:hypothetical protein
MTNTTYTITAADRLGAYSSHPTLADALTTLEQLKQSLDFAHYYIEERAEDESGCSISRKIHVDFEDWELDDVDFDTMSLHRQREYLDHAWARVSRNFR